MRTTTGGIVGLGIFTVVYWLLLAKIARFYWFVPSGLRVACLALLPLRSWPWIVAGEFLARALYDVPNVHAHSLSAYLVNVWNWDDLSVIFLAPLLALPGSWYLRKWLPDISAIRAPREMGWLLAAIFISACGDSLGNFINVFGVTHESLPMGSARFIAGKITGDYIGVIAVAPALLAAMLASQRESPMHSWRADVLTLLGFGGGYVAAMRLNSEAAIYDYARILVLIPVFITAFRHGWRGGAFALTICSVLVALVPAIAAIDPYRNLFTQMLLALCGSAALLLGSAIDTQQASRRALAAQNADLDRLGVELREAAQRNLRLEEEQRRRFAAEIHDELGQNLTAVHTRVKLAAERLDAAQLSDVTTSIYDILTTMRRSVRGLMDSLRPPVLDEFGLVRALREGPLRDLVERAGLRYEFALHGDPALIAALSESTQTAIWRIVQEAATNTVKHAQAAHFRARVRVGVRNTHALVILDLGDDGRGIASTEGQERSGYGLQGMRDRVVALDGAMWVSSGARGTRLRVLLRQAV